MADAPPTFTLCHAIPGRLRVKVTAIRRAAEEADVLAYWLAKLPGIRKAQANPLTGSVILYYDPQATSSPALSKASVGVAMGAGGSETAIAAADIALADDDLRRLIFLRGLSRQTVRVIRQNYRLAVATDLVGSLMAVWGRLTPVLGGLMHLGHAAAISLNSGRLLTWKPPRRRRKKPGAPSVRSTSRAGSKSSAGEATKHLGR